MLRNSATIVELAKSENIFLQFEAVANEFCDYVSANSHIQVQAVYDFERERVKSKFDSLPLETQRKKLNSFISFYELHRDLLMQNIPLLDKVSAFNTFLYRHSLKLPNQDRLFELIDSDVLIEIYDLDFLQAYRSLDYFEKINHSVLAMESCEWWELFERSQHIVDKQTKIVQEVYSGKITEPIFAPVENHTVKEINCSTPYSGQTNVILYSPVFQETGEFEGIMQFFKIEKLTPLDFKIVEPKVPAASLKSEASHNPQPSA